MIQPFHLWVFIQRNWRYNLKRYVNPLPHVHCSIIYIIYKIWKQPKYPLTDEWIKMFFENIFSQPGGLFSHSQCLCSAEFLNCNEVQLINYFFHGSFLWCFKNSSPYPESFRFSPLLSTKTFIFLYSPWSLWSILS